RVVNSKGEPLPKASMSIEQRKLGFPFGCEVEKNIIGNQAYQNWFTKRFTVTTFANEMKWYSTEVVRGKEDYSIADEMLRFFKKHGVAVRGHNLVCRLLLEKKKTVGHRYLSEVGVWRGLTRRHGA